MCCKITTTPTYTGVPAASILLFFLQWNFFQCIVSYLLLLLLFLTYLSLFCLSIFRQGVLNIGYFFINQNQATRTCFQTQNSATVPTVKPESKPEQGTRRALLFNMLIKIKERAFCTFFLIKSLWSDGCLAGLWELQLWKKNTLIKRLDRQKV